MSPEGGAETVPERRQVGSGAGPEHDARERGRWGPGRLVGGVYEIRRELGAGGMGQVYEAWDRALARVVAIKTQHADGVVGALRREAMALASVHHPGVVTVHALGVDGDVDYLVMERVYGVNLETLLARRLQGGGVLELDEVLDLLVGLTEAVAAIHRAGIAHRDLKPRNVLVAPGGRVVVIDLGIFTAENAVEESPAVVGTPYYMAPEAIRAETRAGEACLVDVYALGVIAFELLTGTLPFRGSNPAGVMYQHMADPVPDLLSLRADVPRPLAALVTSLLSKNPGDRPTMADAVLWDLRALRSDKGQRPRAHGFSVLLVDDDPNSRILTELVVRRVVPEAEIVAVQDGVAAVQAATRLRPDLMLLDLDLPRMNGLEVCLALRGTHAADRTSIVLVSGRAHRHDVELLRELGVERFVGKGPAMGRDLTAAILSVREHGAQG